MNMGDFNIGTMWNSFALMLCGGIVSPELTASVFVILTMNTILRLLLKDKYGISRINVLHDFITEIIILMTILYSTSFIAKAIQFEKLIIVVFTVFLTKYMFHLLLMIKRKGENEMDPLKKKLNNAIINKLFNVFAEVADVNLSNTGDDPFEQNDKQDTDNFNPSFMEGGNSMNINSFENNNHNNIETDYDDE